MTDEMLHAAVAQARETGGPVLVAQDLHHTYGAGSAAVEALRGVDLMLTAGELVALVGPSGSGKSTLLHVLSGLEQPKRGTVLLDGRELTALSEDERADLRASSFGFVLQRDNLIPSLTVEENVAAPLLISGVGRDEAMARARELLERVGVGGRARAWPGEVSGGEAQRATVARACVSQPKILFADEPTGALDSATGASVLALFAELVRETGAAALVVTHDHAVADSADSVVRMRDGRIEPDA